MDTMSAVAPRPLHHGVVSLLDSGATGRIRETWTKLDREFGLRGVLVMPFPHFSYQVAGGYDRAETETTLSQLAQRIAPFDIRTKGLATFEGPWPVVYVVVKKDPSLRALHLRVWNTCLPHASEPVPYYRPGAWTPHITLAHGDEHDSIPLSGDKVRAVLGMLNPKEFKWTISVDNIALVWDDGTVQSPVRTFPLRGR
jgi:2'-5' RNA ligase